VFISKRHPSSLRRAAWSLALTLGLGGLTALQAGCGSDPVDEGDDASAPPGGRDGGSDPVNQGDASTPAAGGDGGTDPVGEGDGAFTRIYESPEFQKCGDCHAPGAPGRVAGIESTQNWSTRDSAYASLKGMASGLIGNFAGCNGVPLLGTTAGTSLLVAALDEETRASFMSASKPDCNGDAISDMTLKLGAPLPAALLAELKAWIDAGAPNK